MATALTYSLRCDFFFSSRRRHTRWPRDWSSDVCSSDLEQERFRLQQLWYKYAKKIADWYKDKGDMEQAIHWYVKICDNFPDNEEVNFILMKLYDELQYGILVHHQYKQLKQSLIEINMDVSAEIERWYKRFRRKN